MDDYRNIALQWVAEPDHRPAVEAIAKHLHANESLHLHDNTEGPEPCSYCWLRAAKAVQAIERDSQRISPNEQFDNIRKDREEVRKENERLTARLQEADAAIDDLNIARGRDAETLQSLADSWRRHGKSAIADELLTAFEMSGDGGEGQC